MRSAMVIVLLFGLALALATIQVSNSPTAHAAGLSTKEIGELIEEYADDETSPERREKINERLKKHAKPGNLKKALKKALSMGKTRAAAFDVIVTLEVKGLHKEGRKYVDSEHQEFAVRSMFLSQDRKSEKFLRERWEEAELGSESFEILNSCFQEYFVSKGTIDFFHDIIKDQKKPPSKERGDSARAIIQHQMVLTDDEVKDVTKKWKSLMRTFVLRNRTFNEPGRDLLAEQDLWNRPFEFEEDIEDEEEFEPGLPPEEEISDEELHNARPYRDRILIGPRGTYNIDQVKWENYTIVVWLMILDGDSGRAGVIMEKGNAFLGGYFRNEGWNAPGNTEGQVVHINGARHKWTRFVFRLRGGNISVSVDGTKLTEFSNVYGTSSKGLHLSGGSGHVLIGSVTMEK